MVQVCSVKKNKQKSVLKLHNDISTNLCVCVQAGVHVHLQVCVARSPTGSLPNAHMCTLWSKS